MKTLLILVLLCSIITASAQEPFQLNKSYPVGWVVTYPTSNIMWISTKALKATSYPTEGAYWTRYVPPVVKHDTIYLPVSGSVTRSSFDSLLTVITKSSSKVDSIGARLKVIEIQPLLSLKYSLFGTPLLKIINDTTAIIPALVPGRGISFDTTANQIIVNRQ